MHTFGRLFMGSDCYVSDSDSDSIRIWFRFRFHIRFGYAVFFFFCHLLFAFVAFPHAEMLAGPRGVCAMLLRSCILARISHVSFGMCILALVDPIGNA